MDDIIDWICEHLETDKDRVDNVLDDKKVQFLMTWAICTKRVFHNEFSFDTIDNCIKYSEGLLNTKIDKNGSSFFRQFKNNNELFQTFGKGLSDYMDFLDLYLVYDWEELSDSQKMKFILFVLLGHFWILEISNIGVRVPSRLFRNLPKCIHTLRSLTDEKLILNRKEYN